MPLSHTQQEWLRAQVGLLRARMTADERAYEEWADDLARAFDAHNATAPVRGGYVHRLTPRIGLMHAHVHPYYGTMVDVLLDDDSDTLERRPLRLVYDDLKSGILPH